MHPPRRTVRKSLRPGRKVRRVVRRGAYRRPYQPKLRIPRSPTYSKLPASAYRAEKKLLGLTAQNEKTTTAIQTSAIASMVGFVIGSKPSQWTGNFHNLHGISIPKGDETYQRNGQYVYLCHTNVFFNLEAINFGTQTPPMECRLVVFRAKRASNPAGIAYDPAYTLFLDDLGNTIGHATSGVNGTDLTRRMLNRRDWIIKRDNRFVVSKPMVTSSTGGSVNYSGKYPVVKNFQFKLPYYKKTRYDSNNLPSDTAYHWGVVVYVRSISKDATTVGQIECNLRGNTVFLDP